MRAKKRKVRESGKKRHEHFLSPLFFFSTHVDVAEEVLAGPGAARDVGVGRRGRARRAAAVLFGFVFRYFMTGFFLSVFLLQRSTT